jgi:hypothetical protein
MPEEYHLKLNPIIKQIVKLYAKYDKNELKKGKTVASRLKPLIHAEVNRILDFLNSERSENTEMSEELQKKENLRILKLLEEDSRF